MSEEWFKCWFDSKYYHLLYKNRDEVEANSFLNNLIDKIHPSIGARILDLACGKGRHAKFLADKGFDVVGADLSEESIQYAARDSRVNLKFLIHDMRDPIQLNPFDLILNLFTSFGYFESEDQNELVLKSMNNALTDKGEVVIDFMNANKILKNLVSQETKSVNGIDFHLQKSFEKGIITKNIRFSDQGKDYSFFERVQALTLSDFERMLHKTGFTLIKVFGDYNFNDFDENTSDRLILHFQPKT